MGGDGDGSLSPGQDLPASPRSASRISPRLSLLLIAGLALGGIACMCLVVVALAIRQAN